MDIKPIRTKADHRAALKEIDGLMSATPARPSASTWPKSGLIVASRVSSGSAELDARADRPCCARRMSSRAARWCSARAVRRDLQPPRRPECRRGRRRRRTATRCRSASGAATASSTRSFRRVESRMIITPKVCDARGGYRSWLRGMRNSAVQPSESIRVATSQTASHETSSCAVVVHRSSRASRRRDSRRTRSPCDDRDTSRS